MTDSAANCKLHGEMVARVYSHITWMPCAAHCLDLLLSEVGQLPFAKGPILKIRAVIKFIRSHHWSLALLRRIAKTGSKLELLYPGETRFATNFIMLHRVLQMWDDLQEAARDKEWLDHLPTRVTAPRRVTAAAPAAAGSGQAGGRKRSVSARAAAAAEAVAEAAAAAAAAQPTKESPADEAKRIRSMILDDSLREEVQLVVDIIKPMVQLLRFADSNAPGISKLYYRCFLLTKWVDACSGDEDAANLIVEDLTSSHKAHKLPPPTESELYIPSIDSELRDKLMQLVMDRWEMLNTDIHCAAYALDPEFHGHLADLEEEGEVLKGLYQAINKQYGENSEAAVAARLQWSDYQLKANTFSASNHQMWAAARTLPPHKWWFEFCKGAPELRLVAMRLSSLCMSTGSMERSWSQFDFIHDKRRNRLTPKRANALVSIFSNMQMVRAVTRRAANGKQDCSMPWRWFEEEGEEQQQVEEPAVTQLDEAIEIEDDEDEDQDLNQDWEDSGDDRSPILPY